MITKLCIICLCIAACSLVGLKLYKDSVNRVKYFEGVLSLINTLISEIQFRRQNLKSILRDFCDNNKTPFVVHVKEFLTHLETNEEFKPSKLHLKNEETEEVKHFFSSLGTSDSDTQLVVLDTYKVKFEELRKHYADRHKKYGSLYLKLSFLLGLALGIVIL